MPRDNSTNPALGVRMDDVAERAGVSRATVSRVMSGGAIVSSSTTQRVQDAMRELGYIPNTLAQSLAGGPRTLVGLLLRDPRVPLYGQLHAELQTHADRSGLELITVAPGPQEGANAELAGLHRLLRLRVGGILVATGVLPSDLLAPFLNDVAVVSVGRVEAHPAIDSIAYDELAHAKLLSSAITDAGHQNVAVVVPERTVSISESVRGEALCADLIALGANPVRLPSHAFGTLAGRFDDLIRLVKEGAITAIAFTSDARATRFRVFARAVGVEIPRDVSVTGVDGVGIHADLLNLTTIRLPLEAVAARAIEVLESRIKGRSDEAVKETYRGDYVPGGTLATIDRPTGGGSRSG